MHKTLNAVASVAVIALAGAALYFFGVGMAHAQTMNSDYHACEAHANGGS